MGDRRSGREILRGWLGRGSARLRVRFVLPRGRRGRFRLRRGPDARTAVRILTDARPLDDPTRAPSADADLERKERRKRRGVIAGLALLFVSGSLLAAIGPRGMRDVGIVSRERDLLRAQVEAQQAAVMALRREVQRLQSDPYAAERIAREELGYVRAGEITFILPGEPGPARPTARPAGPSGADSSDAGPTEGSR